MTAGTMEVVAARFSHPEMGIAFICSLIWMELTASCNGMTHLVHTVPRDPIRWGWFVSIDKALQGIVSFFRIEDHDAISLKSA
jgi:hypothetical protein